jgi:hypothetical protein
VTQRRQNSYLGAMRVGAIQIRKQPRRPSLEPVTAAAPAPVSLGHG